MVENWHIFRWILGPKSAGFWAQNPLDFVSFSAAETHIFFADAVGLTSLVLSFLSVLNPSDSTNYKQFLLRGKACCTPVFGPQLPWWILPFRGSWCGFFLP